MLRKNLSLYVDLIFCLILLPAMIMLLPLERWLQNNLLYVVLLLSGLYAIYWVNRLVIIPSLFRSKRNYLSSILFLVCSIFVIYSLSQYKLEDEPPRHPQRTETSAPRGEGTSIDSARVAMAQMRRNTTTATESQQRSTAQRRRFSPQTRLQQQAAWFLFVVVLSFSAVVALLSELYRQSLYRQSVEFEKKKAELALYKAQINPHFLFNTLNTLLGMVITKSERAEDAFVQFATLMRYMYSNSDKDMIPLQTELEYITQYIELQRYRLNDNTQLNITLCDEEQASKYQIAPMLLITFVENALKYGVSADEKSTIDINVSLKGGVMHLTVANPIFTTASSDSKGIGIANCRNRLELIYHGDYTLITKETDGRYYVSLTIKLNK